MKNISIRIDADVYENVFVVEVIRYGNNSRSEKTVTVGALDDVLALVAKTYK
jgi:hypothetical protein